MTLKQPENCDHPWAGYCPILNQYSCDQCGCYFENYEEVENDRK